MKFVLFLLCLVFVGCDFPWNTDDVVVCVGESKLHVADVRQDVPNWDLLSKRKQVDWLTTWINAEVLYQEAQKSNIEDDPKVKRALLAARRKIVTDFYVTKLMDSVSVSDGEARRFYESFPEHFVYGRSFWNVVLVTYSSWKASLSYYKSYRKYEFSEVPKSDYRIQKISVFDSLLETPDRCVAPDLHLLKPGVLSKPVACKGRMMSILVMSWQDSAAVMPYERGSELAHQLAYTAKSHAILDSLMKNLKRNSAVFSNAEVLNHKANED